MNIFKYKLLILAFLILVIGTVVNYTQKDNKTEVDNSIKGSAASSSAGEDTAPAEKTPVEFTLVAGGDVMLSRHVGTKIREAGDPILPFRKIADTFKEADIAFVNLETPFYDQGPPVTEGMVFKAEPETIAGLTHAGIDIVSLANNHTRNKGEAGLIYTLDYLRENNIAYSGAGKNFTEAHSPTIIEQDGFKIAWLSYTFSDGVSNYSRVEAEDPDVAFLETVQMEKDVKAAKENSDLVIVSMHAGNEYTTVPSVQQKEFAHAAIDGGAELIIGHHPHVVQITEEYNDKYIIYSLGNLVFDQMWSEETREGVIARCQFQDTNVKSIEFVPVKIENYNQPRLATGAESARILERMGLEENVIEF
ncbi:MAG: CapA family protein [Parcubacteria group bacterium]